tara:strand:+ start:70 stop:522 length:453 start_codon:yes stop_codon:yes gene_type:complete
MPVKRSKTTVKDRSRRNLVDISSSTKKGKSSGPVTISSKAIDRSAQTTKNGKSKYRSVNSNVIKHKSKDDTGVRRSLQTTKNKKSKYRSANTSTDAKGNKSSNTTKINKKGVEKTKYITGKNAIKKGNRAIKSIDKKSKRASKRVSKIIK